MTSLSRVALVAVALAAFTGTAFAQDPIAERKAAMKKNGAAMGLLVKMTKGEEPYDSAKAKAAVETIAAGMKGYDTLFPAGSDTGETKAGAKIWEDMAGFKAAVAKAEQAATTSAPLAAKDLDGVKAAVGALGQTCSGCHNTYRKS